MCKNNSMFFYNNTCLDPSEYCGLVDLTSLNNTHCFNPDNNDNVVAADGAVPRVSPSEDYYK